MKKQSSAEKEHIEKLTNNYLSNLGFEHINNICDEYNQNKKNIEQLHIPKELNQWFNEFSKNYNKRNKYKKMKTKLIKHQRIAVIVLLTLIISSTLVTVSVDALRIKFFNLFVETHKQFTSLKLKETDLTNYDKIIPSDWKHYYSPTYLPTGFNLTSATELNQTKYMIFTNESDETIIFLQGPMTGNFQLDSENGTSIEIDINNFKGLIVEKDGLSIITWHNNNTNLNLESSLSKTTLLEIAESIKKNN